MYLRRISFLFTLLTFSLVISCADESSDPNDENSAPGNFTVTASDVSTNSATISWTTPTDEDGDDLTYDVIMGQSTVSSNQASTNFNFSNLQADTNYSGSVVAKDGNGGQSEASFSFKTQAEGGNENQNPGSFTVTIETISHNSAQLFWTTSTDPDGDQVTYSIELGSEEITSGSSTTSYELTGLSSGAEFSGKVIASDGNGGLTESAFTFISYVIDISKYESMPGFVSATLVDCNYSEGGSGQCYQIVFNSNPVDDDGPFCPSNVQEIGGFGNYNGDGEQNDGPTDGAAVGFSVMNAALFQAMENDGYDIIKPNGDIRISDFTSQDNPNFGYCLEPLPDDNLQLTFEIPVIPTSLNAPDDIATVEYVGLALDGVPINGTPPAVAGEEAQGEGKIPSLDRCGGHHDPAGYYHWHFIAAHMNATLDAQGLLDVDNDIQCTKKTQEATALVGYARDGYPIYSGQDQEGVDPTDLDGCNGHTHETAEYPDGIYHYHASTDITNIPPCIMGKQSVKAFDKPQ